MRERTHALAFIRHALALQPGPLIQDVERITESRDRDSAERFLLLLLTWFRDALVFSHGGSVINVDQVEDLRRFTALFPAADLQQVIAEIERAISLVRRNVFIKLVFLQLAVRLKRTIARTA